MESPDQTARILPFRRHPPARTQAEFQLRLQQALATLNDALAAQAGAVAAWRDSPADLGARAAHLAETAASFQQALAALAAEMARQREADPPRRRACPSLP